MKKKIQQKKILKKGSTSSKAKKIDPSKQEKSSKDEILSRKLAKNQRTNRILLSIIVILVLVFSAVNIISLKSTIWGSKDNPKIIMNTTKSSEETQDIITTPDGSIISSQETPASNEKSNLESTEPAEKKNDDTEQKQEQDETPTKTTTLTLYFTQTDASGNTTLIKETREIAQTPAILTSSINELLKGPKNTDTQNLIPEGTKLNSARVSQDIAYLDFNDNFEFNAFGSAGLLAQLYQIVYTCTEISSINAVQITINGEKKQFIGGEGNIQISSPLSRSDVDKL